MRTVTRRLTATLTIAVAGAAVACQPAPLGSIRPPADGYVLSCDQEPAPTARQRLDAGETPCVGTAPLPDVAPVDGTLVLIDSIGWQTQMSAWYGGPGMTRAGYGYPGWTLEHTVPYLRRLEHRDQVRLVVAVGTNEANPVTGGWDTRDEAALRELDTLGFRCVSFVSPALGLGPERFAGHRANVAQVRQRYLDTGRPVVEWAPYAETPGVLSSDGIHLTERDPFTGDIARNAVVEQAVTACAG